MLFNYTQSSYKKLSSSRKEYIRKQAKKRNITLEKYFKIKVLEKKCLEYIDWKHLQTAFLNVIKSQDTRNRIEQATGTGKTTILGLVMFYKMISKMIIQGKNKPGYFLGGVLAPRIMLSYQLQTELLKIFKYFSNDYDLSDITTILIHSGGKNNTDEMEDVKAQWIETTGKPLKDFDSTTNRSQISDYLKLCKEKDIPCFMVSTYHSAPTLNKVLIELGENLDFAANDEAHYLVAEKFSKLYADVEVQDENDFTENEVRGVDELRAINCLFATATEKYTHSENSVGLNNVNRFGEKVFHYPAWQAIKDKVIAKPRGGFLRISNGHLVKINNQRHFGEVVVTSFDKFRELNKKYNNGIGTKMVVRVRNTPELRFALESDEIKQLQEKGVNIAVVGSQVGHWINGKKLTGRPEFLSEVKSLGNNPEVELIIFHINIITEGVDVPGLNCFIATCLLSWIQMIQNVGRVLRSNKHKKYAFIGVPGFVFNLDNKEKFRKLLNSLEDEYGEFWKPDLTVDDDWAESPGEKSNNVDDEERKNKKNKKDNLDEFINDFEWEQFEKQVSNLKGEKQLDKLLKEFRAI